MDKLRMPSGDVDAGEQLTRRRFLQGTGALLTASAWPLAARAQSSLAAAAAGVLHRRLGSQHADQFHLHLHSDLKSAQDWFEITGSAGAIAVEGSSTSALLMGAHWYLRHVAGASISWNGDSLSLLPRILPAPSVPMRRDASARHRFALNDTNDGYTGPYWEWARWEWLIDVLALHGINEVLVYMGAEAVYQRTMRKFGYTDDELRRWFPTPAHQPWWLLENMSGWVGPFMPQHLIDSRATLGRRICDRLRELGMEPVLPGYYGVVPDGFARRQPDAEIVPQGDWLGMKRPDWLAPTCAKYPEVARIYYREQRAVLGQACFFKMDPLHEGGRAGSVSVSGAAAAIEAALEASHPDATWAVLGWQENPRRELLDGIRNRGRMLILDGLSDRYAPRNLEQKWENTPYAFGAIWNFGGHTTIGSNLCVWNDRYFAQLNKAGSCQNGIAVMPEASCNNPTAFAFLTDLAWSRMPYDVAQWFREWSAYRYGAPSDGAGKAWEIARQTVYNEQPDGWSESHDSLFCAQPSLDAHSAAQFSPQEPRYDMAAFAPAVDGLLAVPVALRHTTAYRYDLVDFARQAIANESRVRLPEIKAAYEAKDVAVFRLLTAEWLERMEALNRVAGAEPDYLLGRWLAAAITAGKNETERAEFSFDGRSILLEWGPRGSETSGVHDYANREWNGLLLYYRERWKMYFNALEEALVRGAAPRPIDWFDVDRRWSQMMDSFPIHPEPDFYAIVQSARTVRRLTGPSHRQSAHNETAFRTSPPVTRAVVFG